MILVVRTYETALKEIKDFFYDNDYTLWRDNLQYIDTQEKIDLVFSSDKVDDRLLDYIYTAIPNAWNLDNTNTTDTTIRIVVSRKITKQTFFNKLFHKKSSDHLN